MKIKKFTSVLLISAMLLSAAACGAKQETADDTASGAVAASASSESYAEWLDARLGADAEGVIVGMADDADRYGISLDGLRDEGYVIRKENGKALIFGAGEDGLDRGVRYYANHFADVDSAYYTYGEGYRVKRLTVAGNDISEYAILIAADADECHRYAASELQKFIQNACGAELPIVTDAPAGHVIRLEQITKSDPRYETLGDEGFTIAVKDGDITITGGVLRGCMYGVYELLEGYVGYTFIFDYDNYLLRGASNPDAYEIDYLYESDHVDIPEGTLDTQVPSFTLRWTHAGSTWGGNSSYVSRVKGTIQVSNNRATFNNYGVIWYGGHGIGSAVVAGYIPGVNSNAGGAKQPCFSDEDVIDGAIEYYLNYIDGQVKAGNTIGRELVDIDVGQLDSGGFCMCANCMKLIQLDGGHVGPVLNFTNAIADAVNEIYHDENGDPVIYVKFLAYHGTNMVPKVTRPRENVVPNYCFIDSLGDNSACYSHPISGEACTGPYRENFDAGYVPDNRPYAAELAGWCEIAKKVIVWYYPGRWQWQAVQTSVFKNLRADMAFLNSFDNVYGVHSDDVVIQADEKIVDYLLYRVWWNADMTEEEYQNYIKEYYFIMGGDGGEYIYEQLKDMESIQRDECWTTMGWTDASERLDLDAYADRFDYYVELYRKALANAGSAAEEDFILKQSRYMYFTGLIASHTDMYLNGTDEERARYTEYFEYFKKIALDTGFYVYDKNVRVREDMFDIETNLAAVMFDFNQTPGGSATWWE